MPPDTEHTRKKYPVPDENIEPEIERALTIPFLDQPAPWQGYIRPEDLDQFKDEPGLLSVLTGIGKLNEGQDYLIQNTLLGNRYMRRMEAEQFRLRKQLATEKEERENASKLDLWAVIRRIATAALILGLGAGAHKLFA